MPRSLQSTVGLLTGMLVAGVTLGGLVGVVSAIALGRFGRLTPRATTLSVAAMGFVVVYAVPFLIYPPNPPAVGSGDTIGMRSGLYFVSLAISLIAAVTAVLIGRRLADRLGGWHAALASIAGYVVVMLIVMALMPHYNEVPDTFPATILYEFRQGQLPDPAHSLDGARRGAGRVRRPAVARERDDLTSRLPRSVPEPLRGPVSSSVGRAGAGARCAGRRAGQADRRARPARGPGRLVVGLLAAAVPPRHRRTYARWCSPATTA